MSTTKFHLKHFLLSLSLLVSAHSPLLLAEATDTVLVQQKADCLKDTSSEWSDSLNRCVGKAAAIQTRQEADACNALTDLTARQDCHKALAEKKSGLSSDTGSLNQGNTTGSMVMNAAYSIVTLLSMTGAKSANSACTSKKIFGVTAVAGLASDFFLKFKAKKKVKDLADKYKLDVKTGASDAQVKALQYLKDEQNTVAEIAGLEKKRNMLLMMGYGAAGVMAAYEMAFPAANAGCMKKEEVADGKVGNPPETSASNVAPTTTGAAGAAGAANVANPPTVRAGPQE